MRVYIKLICWNMYYAGSTGLRTTIRFWHR